VMEKIVTDYRAQPGPEWVEWASRPSVTVEIRHGWLAANL